jgi:hypothetical protein
MRFFKFTDGAIELDKDAIALYPNVKKILARDRGGKVTGDPDGRLKLYAFKEFTYVYFRCDFEAYPAQHGLSEKETHLYAAKEAGLGKDYEPDDLVLHFIKQYEKEHLTPAKQAIKTLIRVFAFNNNIVEKMEKVLSESLTLPTLTPQQVKDLLDFQKQLISIATDVPIITKKLKEAMNLLQEEDKLVEIGRGGEEVTDSFRPDNNIENG